MTRAVALTLRGRRRAEALMVDQCTITRTVGEAGEVDPNTGLRVPPATEVVYSGKCKVQTYEPHESKPDAAEHVWTVQRYSVHIPVDAGPAAVDDRIQITYSVIAPHLVGRTYRVAGIHHKSLTTAQRLLVDEVTG